MGYALRDENRHTYAEYRSWPEEIRYELIGGHAFLISPAPSTDHQTLAFEVAHQLRSALEGKSCRVFMAPVDVLLARAEVDEGSVDTVVQPDVLVVCDPTKVSPRHVRGAPDWVLEVVSPSSASHDQIVKLAAYEKAGVREYWIAHPTDRVLTIYGHDGKSYSRPEVRELIGSTPVGVLDGVMIQWASIVAQLRPIE